MGLWNALEAFGKLPAAKAAVDTTEKIRREKTKAALLELAAIVRGRESVSDRPDDERIVDQHLDKVLAAASQGNAVREVAKVFGVYDTLRGFAGDLVDKLEGKG